MFDHHDHQEADHAIFKLGQSIDDVAASITRLVEMTATPAGKVALDNHVPTLLWQRCRLGNVLEQIGVPLLRAAS